VRGFEFGARPPATGTMGWSWKARLRPREGRRVQVHAGSGGSFQGCGAGARYAILDRLRRCADARWAQHHDRVCRG